MAVNTKALIQLERIQKKVEQGLIIPQSDMQNIGIEMADKIRVRTRIGQDKFRTPLKILSPKYIAYRNKHRSELYYETTSKKSNLTFTGQLLNSMKVDSLRPGQFMIDFKEGRKPKKNEKVKNSDIVYYQKEKGRDFFGFSDAEMKYLAKRIITYFKERLGL